VAIEEIGLEVLSPDRWHEVLLERSSISVRIEHDGRTSRREGVPKRNDSLPAHGPRGSWVEHAGLSQLTSAVSTAARGKQQRSGDNPSARHLCRSCYALVRTAGCS